MNSTLTIGTSTVLGWTTESSVLTGTLDSKKGDNTVAGNPEVK